MLCQSCQKIFGCDEDAEVAGKIKKSAGYPVSLRLIHASGQGGCELCAQLAQRIKTRESDGEDRHQLQYHLSEHLDHEDRFKLSFKFTPMPFRPHLSPPKAAASKILDSSFSFDFQILTAESLASNHGNGPSTPATKLLSETTGNLHSWELALHWIDKCNREHPGCQPNSRPQKWYPTRLLDVGRPSGNCTEEVVVRLHSTKHEITSGHYITVSHRWGKEPSIMLTSHTVERLQNGISLDELPQTFVDAIVVARRMGIQYIWIDCLCIMQDSTVEWRSESSTMGLVYKNSYLNVAAIESPDCDAGLFFPRNNLLVQPIKLTMKFDAESNRNEEEYLCIDGDVWLGVIDESLLGKRAWYVQERLLSPRQIHFASHQMYWECRWHAACETLPGGILPSMMAQPGQAASYQMKRFAATLSEFSIGNRPRNESNNGLAISLNCDENANIEIYTGWRHTVANYSKCALTYPKDKLVAISGVAKEMSKVVNDQYLAGIWRSQLPAILLWCISEAPTTLRFQQLRDPDEEMWVRPRPLLAPTWSWASVQTPIAFFFPVERKKNDFLAVDILEAHVEPAASDLHGEILDGYLRLRCMLYPVTLIYDGDTSPPTQSIKMRDTVFPSGVFLDESPLMVGTGRNLHLMPIFFRDWADKRRGPTQIRGLLLQPSGRGEGHFERFGLFADWGNRDLEVFREPYGEREELEYEEALGDGRFIITIT